MKKILFCCLIFTIFPAAFAKSVYVIDPAAPSHDIVIPAGVKTFSVALSSNPTTGFSWQLKSYEGLCYVKHDYRQRQSKLIGAPGIEYFRFQFKTSPATAAQGQIRLAYVRPWETPKTDNSHDTIITWHYAP